MPWIPSDASKHTKLAKTAQAKRQWADVANDTLERCLSRGGDPDTCEGEAIRRANSTLQRRQSEMGKTTINEATKTIGGVEYPASAFLVVEDPDSPSTWHLPVKDPDGSPNHRLMGAAWAALHGGYRGQKYGGPMKNEAIRKLRTLYRSEDMETPSTEVQTPEALQDLDSLIVEEERAAEVGKRLQSKQLEALRQAAQAIGSLLKWAEYGDQEDVEDEEDDTEEALTPIGSMSNAIMSSFYRTQSENGEYFPIDIVLDHPVLGNSVLCTNPNEACTYAVPFMGGDGQELTFAPHSEWVRVTMTYIPVPESEPEGLPEEPPEETPVGGMETETEPELEEIQIGESASGVVEEIHVLEETGENPLEMDVILIRPGFGNKRDNHYYPAEMLKRDSHVFEGAKMYETDHVQSEKSTRTWVSTVKSIKGFTEEGAPIGQVVVHDSDFADRVRNLKKAGLLEKMECSILAVGRSKKAEVDGVRANVVEQLTNALSVDWVTQAGAGGKAIALSETETETEDLPEVIQEEVEAVEVETVTTETDPETTSEDEPEPETETAQEPELETGEDPNPEVQETPAETEPQVVYLTEGEVATIVNRRAGLPQATKTRLLSQEYETAEQVKDAIESEVAYLKEVTNAGKPFALSGTPPTETQKKRMTDEEYENRMARIMEKYK